MADEHDRNNIRKQFYDLAITALVEKVRRADPGLSQADAMGRIFRQDPELYQRYRHLSYVPTR